MMVFVENFNSDIFTFFFIWVKILGRDDEIEFYISTFLMYAVYDYAMMIVVILLNTLINCEVGFKSFHANYN